jgi:hypothetical protein
MPSIAQELGLTPTAAWYQAARSAERARDWNDRLRCFGEFSNLLAEYRTPRKPGQRWSQQPVRPHGMMPEIARRAYSSPETVYRRWRAQRADPGIPRWAGADQAVRPGPAFVAEAKIVAFWPYREGALGVADDFDMTLTEIAACYFRALAAWASDVPALAACEPGGVPGCAVEDLEVIARRFARQSSQHVDCAALTTRLEQLARHLVDRTLEDASLTPLGAFNTVRDEFSQLLAQPEDPIAARVSSALAELTDRLSRHCADEVVISPYEARQLQMALNGLTALLAGAGAAVFTDPAQVPAERAGP